MKLGKKAIKIDNTVEAYSICVCMCPVSYCSCDCSDGTGTGDPQGVGYHASMHVVYAEGSINYTSASLQY